MLYHSLTNSNSRSIIVNLGELIAIHNVLLLSILLDTLSLHSSLRRILRSYDFSLINDCWMLNRHSIISSPVLPSIIESLKHDLLLLLKMIFFIVLLILFLICSLSLLFFCFIECMLRGEPFIDGSQIWISWLSLIHYTSLVWTHRDLCHSSTICLWVNKWLLNLIKQVLLPDSQYSWDIIAVFWQNCLHFRLRHSQLYWLSLCRR